jgi:hypothetical protein
MAGSASSTIQMLHDVHFWTAIPLFFADAMLAATCYGQSSYAVNLGFVHKCRKFHSCSPLGL